MTSNINLQDYYSKISQMRNKILSRHQTNQGTNTKISQITFSENINTYVAPVKQTNIANNIPLAEINDNRRTINCRVKELDDINDKIKSMLAYKRSVQKTNTFVGERSSSIQKNERNIDYKLKMPQSIITEPKNRFDNIPDKRELLRNNQQQYKESRYVSKYQSFNPTVGPRVSQKASTRISQKASTNIGQMSLKPYILPTKQPSSEANMGLMPLNKAISQNYNEEIPQAFLKSPERQKLARLLLKQVQIDRKLQEIKQNFAYYSNPEKNSILQAAFQKRGSRLSKEQIESWTKFHSQQSNPFLAIASFSSFDSDEFASQVIQAKQHWERVVKEALSISNLEKQSFTITQIDPQAKGFITIEDLVCYLNINSPDAFLRNRDLFSLFKRLKRQQRSDFGQNKLRYETFLNFIAK